MKKEIVYTDKYALILSDEIPTKIYYDTYIHQLKHTGGAEYGESSIAKTVVGHLPLSDAPILEGVSLLPPLPQGEDVELIAKQEAEKLHDKSKHEDWGIYDSLVDEDAEMIKIGYNKAKEKYKYTEEDVRRAIDMSKDIKYVTFSIDEIIQSLQQPSRPNHFECEVENKIAIDGHTIIGSEPKTTTNSQGQVELVGKYSNQ